MRQPAIYILANKPNGTLYTGVTSNLPARVYQHKQKCTRSFTTKFGVTRLVYFELFEDMCTAIGREKQLKGGSRAKKIALIRQMNPAWRDLYEDIISWS